MNKFVSKLEELDYFLFVRAYSGLYRPLEIAAMRLHLPPNLRLLVDVFSLRQEVDADDLASIVTAPTLERLLEAKVLIPSEEESNNIRGKCVLMEVCGHPYFFEPSPDPIAYFAEDSLALERYTGKTNRKKVLDLCAGPGLQSLSLARHSEQVTAVEIDESAYRILLLNIEMNVNRGKITAINTSVADFIEATSEQFEQIVCNPPLLPLPNDLPYPLAGHGGPDGLRVTRGILENAARICVDSGCIEILGASLYSAEFLMALGFLTEACHENGLSMTLLELSRYPWRNDSIFFQNLLATAVYQSLGEETQIAFKLQDFMKANGASGIAMFFSKFTKVSKICTSVNKIDFSLVSQDGWFF